MNEPSDRMLLERWAGGDAQAGDALVRRHFDGLYGFFRTKLGGEIDDLIQRTWLAALQTHARLRSDDAFRAYLFAIARNELYGYLRRGRTRPQADLGASSIDALLVETSQSAERVVARKAEHVLLIRALRRLALDDQIALELFYWKGLSASEVGEVFDVTASTIRTRLQRARAKLTELVAELSDDARLIESTIDGFERWSSSLQVQREA